MLRRLALALPLFLVAACDSGIGNAQLLFEDEALLSPVTGITRTQANGTVVSEDVSDWRIGPAYAGIVSVLQLPFPNPVSASADGDLFLDLNITGDVRGVLVASVLYIDPLREFPQLVELTSCTTGTICPFQLSARQLRDGGGGGGLYRVVVTDGRDGVVTYGDVQVDS